MDFCHKYSHAASLPNSLPNFIKKLQHKNQTEQQIGQANEAIAFFYKLIESYKSNSSPSLAQSKDYTKKLENVSTLAPNISKNQSWKNEFKILTNEIKIRQYSRKTLRAYTNWVRKYQAYLKSKSPKLLESIDAKKFITHLAVHPVR